MVSFEERFISVLQDRAKKKVDRWPLEIEKHTKP